MLRTSSFKCTHLLPPSLPTSPGYYGQPYAPPYGGPPQQPGYAPYNPGYYPGQGAPPQQYGQQPPPRGYYPGRGAGGALCTCITSIYSEVSNRLSQLFFFGLCICHLLHKELLVVMLSMKCLYNRAVLSQRTKHSCGIFSTSSKRTLM